MIYPKDGRTPICLITGMFPKKIRNDNAHLIVAAPDLLEALLLYKELFGVDGDYTICRKDDGDIGMADELLLGELYAKFADAIAKARGETP